MKRLAYALAITAMTAVPALAQSASTDFVKQAQSGDYRASKFVGINIYGADKQKIGDVNDVIVSSSGQIRDIVIGVGGLLGLGEKNIAVPFSAVQWTDQPMQADSAALNGAVIGGTGSVGTATGGTAMNGTAPNTAMAMSANGTAMNGMAPKAAPPNAAAADGTMSTAATTGSVPAGTNPQATMSVAANTAMSNGPKDYPDHGMVNLTKDQLQSAPAFKYASEM